MDSWLEPDHVYVGFQAALQENIVIIQYSIIINVMPRSISVGELKQLFTFGGKRRASISAS
jgi:hypothetical protein